MIISNFCNLVSAILITIFGCSNPTVITGKSNSGTCAVSTKPGTGQAINFEILYTKADSIIFVSIAEKYRLGGSKETDFDKLIIAIAKEFLGAPYIASTLEADGEEKLVINLRELDCTTFVEYVLAMALSLQKDNPSFRDFAHYLTTIRYRTGILDGYPSRLHYFTDWMVDNASKGLVDIVSNRFGDAVMVDSIYFMSSHPHSYRQLSNPLYLQKIRGIERQVSGYRLKYLTKGRIDANAHLIKDGDIIAFKTAIKGLDVSHTGFAVNVAGRLYLLHASISSKEVEITSMPLQEYLSGLRNVLGILVARPILSDYP